jgi:VanZ family protein
MRHTWLVAALAWAGAIFVASSIPNPPDAGGQDWKYELAHVVEYAVLAGLTLRALGAYVTAGGKRLTLIAWAIAAAYGLSDEFHQSFVPHRDASLLDVGFDAFGAALGVSAAWVAGKRKTGGSPPRWRHPDALEADR